MKDQLFYVQKGREALTKAIGILEDGEGWKVEIAEVSRTDMNPSTPRRCSNPAPPKKRTVFRATETSSTAR